MKKIFIVLSFTLISFVVVLSRFWQLGELPPGTYVDMPSFAIEAQSLIETGKDTWGETWPLYFKAYGEYKAPGLIYAYIPLIAILNQKIDPLIARLPSAIAGIGIIILTYFIFKLLIPVRSRLPHILLTLLFAFTPWFFGLSRVYFETNGGLFFLVLALYSYLRLLTSPSSIYLAILAPASLALSGYWYASYRYIGLAILIFSVIFSSRHLQHKIKFFIKNLLVYLLVGIGWVQFLISPQGLTRFTQYQGMAKFGEELVVNEKRAFCYLNFGENYSKSRLCYPLWNKPILRMNETFITYAQYITPSTLFLEPSTEYGIDKDYAAFHWPLIIGYFIGIYFVISSNLHFLKFWFLHKKSKTYDTGLLLISFFTLIGFFPASLTQEIAIHRATAGLYGISLITYLGLYLGYKWTKENFPYLIGKLIIFSFTLLLIFLIIQSQLNYFTYFTRSHDIYWGSDYQALYTKIKEIEPHYDRIIDNVYMGPLDAAFNGLIPVSLLQNAERTDPSNQGFTYVKKAGKFEMMRKGLDDLICDKIRNEDVRRTLVIINTMPVYRSQTILTTYTWEGANAMNDILDLDQIIDFDLSRNIDWQKKCQ